MIVATALSVTLDEVGVRLDAVVHVDAAFRLLSEPNDQAELQEYLGGAVDPIAPIADRRFELAGTGYRAGRYNSEAFPAFYISRDEDASRAEVLHYNPIDKVRDALEAYQPIYLELTEWRLASSAEDLLPPATVDTRLTQDDWGFCQAVGADVRSRVDAIVYPSARLAGAANYAVYERGRVTSLPRAGRKLELRLDATNKVVFVS